MGNVSVTQPEEVSVELWEAVKAGKTSTMLKYWNSSF